MFKRVSALIGILFVYFILCCVGTSYAYTSIGAGAWADIYADLNANFGQIETDIAAKQDMLVSGTNIKTVNSTSLLGSGDITIEGSGAVDSVNGATGVVVLDADDIDDTSTANKFVTISDLTNLGNLSGTNTGDQDISGKENVLTCTTGQIKKWGASGWECDADDTGSGSVPDGTVDGQVLLWATDQWVASTFPVDLASPGEIGGTTPAAGTFTTITAAAYQSSAADGSRYSTLPNNTSAPSAATVVNGLYTYNNALYGVENSGTASLLLMANDIGVSVQAYDANMISWPSAISATEVGYLDGLTEAISTTLSNKVNTSTIIQSDDCSGETPTAGVLCFEY